MKHFDDMIRQSLNESVENKDTSVTFEQIEKRNIETKVKKKWINKMNVGIGSIAALLLIALISISSIHPHSLDRSGQTSPNANISQKTSNIDKKTYASLSRAKDVFMGFTGGPPGSFQMNASTPIELGSGIKAQYKEYDFPRKTFYCQWTQRKYTVRLETYESAQKGQQMAKKIANYINKAKLPTPPNDTGVISFIPNSMNYPTIAWREGKTIYSFKRTDADSTWIGLNLIYTGGPHPNNISTSLPSKTKQDPLTQTTLKLPTGKVISPSSQTVHWKDLSIHLYETYLGPNFPNKHKFSAIYGNHSKIVRQEKVSTPSGNADLFLITPPVAYKITKAKYEYIAIVYGGQYAYSIEANVLGNKDQAKNEVMELMNNWKVPQ